MAIGRTFKEALQKALRSLEQGRAGLGCDGKDIVDVRPLSEDERREWRRKVLDRIKTPRPGNIFYLRYGFQLGISLEELFEATKIDPWFLYNIKQIVDFEDELYSYRPSIV
jgi:carbamoyl-phosphate synthase large subunit